MSKRIYQSSKSDILAAAKTILLTEGLGNLTTDNVIAKSGLSKGGFFYHFKTKNDLILSLGDMVLEDWDKEIQARISVDKNKKGATLRACVDYALSETHDEMIALCRSMVEVLFDKNSSSDKYIEYSKGLVKKILSEGLNKMTVMTVLLALDGYWYNEMFGTQPFSKKEMKAFIKHLHSLTLQD